MSKNAKYLIVGVVLIGMIVLMFFFGSKSGEKNSKKSKTSSKNIIKKDSATYKRPINPNGTFLLYKLLENYKVCNSLQKIQTTYEKGLEDVLPYRSKNEYPNVYFTITENFQINTDDVDWLLNFVSEGNTAFVAAEEFRYDILDLFTYVGISQYYDTTIVTNYFHPKFQKEESVELKNGELNSHGYPKYKLWSYFNQSDLHDNVIKISYISSEDFPVCVSVKYGDGYFILHTLPPTFSNINLLNKEGKTHAETILSHLPKGNIYWHHDYGKYSPYRGITQPSEAYDSNSESNYPKSSPLQYILKVPSLLAALILLIIGLVLYMVFQSKRRQRIIPAIETNENSSVEFVETVSKLYFQQKRHDKLIKHKEQIFLSFIKHQYYLSSPTITDEFIKRIKDKSGIDEDRIKDLFASMQRGKTNQHTSETELIELYNKLEYFYKNCN